MFDLDFIGPENASFLYFIFQLSNHFFQRSYQKITRFHNEYEKFLELPTFSQRFEI